VQASFADRRIQGRERAWQDSFTAYAGSRAQAESDRAWTPRSR
jgi:hypothetical protein